jgi:glycosyltransferase involved in cell wall biosynthesis
MPDKKAFVILSPGFPRDEFDSTCLPAQQQFVLALQKKYPGLQIIVLAFEYPFSRNAYQWNGVSVIPFDGWKQSGWKKFFLWRRINASLRQLKEQYEIVGLLSFWLGACALVGKRFAGKHQLRHFIWLLGQDAKKGNRYAKYTRPQPEELIAISDFIADHFEVNYGPRPGQVIPYGVAENEITKENNNRSLDIIGVGSLSALKQYDQFVDCVKAISDKHPGLLSCICGKGEEEVNLAEKIEELGCEKNLQLKGEQPHSEVMALMERSKIFLHPSSYEGFSSACLEALSRGCHVVSFVQPMHQDIPHWHVVKSKDEMIDCCVQLLNEPALDHHPVIPYTIDGAVEKIMKLFSQ